MKTLGILLGFGCWMWMKIRIAAFAEKVECEIVTSMLTNGTFKLWHGSTWFNKWHFLGYDFQARFVRTKRMKKWLGRIIKSTNSQADTAATRVVPCAIHWQRSKNSVVVSVIFAGLVLGRIVNVATLRCTVSYLYIYIYTHAIYCIHTICRCINYTYHSGSMIMIMVIKHDYKTNLNNSRLLPCIDMYSIYSINID